jgi:hypothetical protein
VNTVPTSFSADYVCSVKDHRVAAGPSREQSEVPACFGASSQYSPECVEDVFWQLRMYEVL